MLVCICCVALLQGGCSTMALAPARDDLPEKRSTRWDPRDWATVLRENVREGRVDYQHLATHRRPLDLYLGRTSKEGPGSTPDLFPTRSDRIAYWINAYNALALRFVLEQYPTDSVYKLGVKDFLAGYRFPVDGAPRSLAEIRGLLMEEVRGDVRVVFCLCAAARGAPALADLPYTGFDLERRLDEAARRAMENEAIIRIDNLNAQLLISLDIFTRQQEFIEYYQRRYRTGNATLLQVLNSFAGPRRRSDLAAARGYPIVALPFDRVLNDWKPSDNQAQSKPSERHRPVVGTPQRLYNDFICGPPRRMGTAHGGFVQS
jgi:hypothetical protein